LRYVGVNMGYKIVAIQNSPARPEWFKDEWVGGDYDIWENPTIVIKIGDPEWESAYSNWLDQKPPTSSPEWKKGVVAITELINAEM